MDKNRVDFRFARNLNLSGLNVVPLELQVNWKEKNGSKWISSAVLGGPRAFSESHVQRRQALFFEIFQAFPCNRADVRRLDFLAGQKFGDGQRPAFEYELH